MGWVEHPEYEGVEDLVLRECRKLEFLLNDRPNRRSCCWQIREPHRYVEEESVEGVVFTGSCAGFVEHCYEAAGVDLVDERQLPDSKPLLDEPFHIHQEYGRATGGTIKRLYPSYQIRAFQRDTYPWIPDINFRWFPERFEE